MVVQKTINDLKDRPKDERKAVAGGVAIFVIVILLIAWAVLFFRRIQSGAQQTNLSAGAQDQFNFTSVKQAQQALQQTYASTTEDLQQIRTDAASQQMQTQQMGVQQTQAGGTDQFGNSNSGY